MSFNFLSSFGQKITHRTAQLYSNLMPIPCLLCGSDSSNECLCQDCVHTLPTLEHACPRCATPLEHTMICGQCLHHPPQQNSSFSLYLYQPPITRLIADLKYYDKLFLSRFFAGKMAKQLKDRPLPQLLIPIPLHPRRLRYRGYNQSLVLAKYLSALLTIPIGSDMLIRTRDTASQASLPYTQRKQNIQRAFKVNHNTLPSHVALIDDVLTTGHTADIAAKSLRQAGVDIIDLWTIARTIRHY